MSYYVTSSYNCVQGENYKQSSHKRVREFLQNDFKINMELYMS